MVLLICVVGIAGSARSDDGFVSDKEYKSYFFDIYAEKDIDKDKIVMGLYSPPSLTALIRKSISMFDINTVSGVLDVLYMGVAEIMDMRLRKFRCSVKICKDTDTFEKLKESIYGQKTDQRRSFYLPQSNTIYINSEKPDISAVGYAMSQAIQTNYFIVPAPESLQEITAGYVEFELKRYTKNNI